jgi:hypothetical protein
MPFSLGQIPAHILGNLANDLIKRLPKNPYAPIDNTIARTAAAFPQYEGLCRTLREWLGSLAVARALTKYVEGRLGRGEVDLEELVDVLIRDAQFYLPDGAEAAASEIISRFLVEIRDQYLKLPQRGIPHIANRLEILRAESWEQFDELIACEPALHIDRPAKLTRERIDPLLRPHNAFIGLIGRMSELAELDAFCDDPAAFRWKVLTGHGGVGKTRLALELAKRREQSGWRAGFLSTESVKSWVGCDRFQAWAPVADTLVTIDYAGGRTDHLKILLERCGGWAEERDGRARVRLLLLEREADPESGWLHGLLSSPEGSLRDQIQGALAPVREIKVPGGPDSDAAIVEILRATFEAWARLPGERKAPPFPELDEAALRELRRQTEGRPLLLQMAALRACDHGKPEMLTGWRREDLLEYAVRRERHYVERRCGAGTTRALLVERGVAFLTFTGPTAKDDRKWLRLLSADAQTRGYPHAQPGEVSQDVAALLGESQEDHGSRIVPLGPDLLAEAFAVTVFSAGSGSPVRAIEAALKCAGPAAWVSLLRATVDLYGLEKLGTIESWLVSLVPTRARPELYIIERLVPEHSVALRRIAAAVGESQLRALPSGEKEDAERARILNNLANRNSALGRREEALGAAERASAIYERLAQQIPDAFEPDSATSLGALGTILHEGNPSGAARAFRRGVETLRRLFLRHPKAFAPRMAALLKGYLETCQSSGREPDFALLAPILEAFKNLPPPE